MPATEDVMLPFYSQNESFNISEIFNYINRANTICYKKCSEQECTSISYMTFDGPSFQPDNDEETVQSTIFSLLRPESPRIIYQHKPKMDFIAFFTYASSTISFWYGISAFVLVQSLVFTFQQLHAGSKVGFESKKPRNCSINRISNAQYNWHKTNQATAQRNQLWAISLFFKIS